MPIYRFFELRRYRRIPQGQAETKLERHQNICVFYFSCYMMHSLAKLQFSGAGIRCP